MELKKAIILIPVLLAMVLLISSKVSARGLKVVEKLNAVNKASYVNGGYRDYPYNGGGYPSNGGGYVSSYYPGIGRSYYPGIGRNYYPGIGGYGGGYPINRGYVGGYNGGVVPGNIGGIMGDIRSYIGGYINGRLRNGGRLGVQTEDNNTRN